MAPLQSSKDSLDVLQDMFNDVVSPWTIFIPPVALLKRAH